MTLKVAPDSNQKKPKPLSWNPRRRGDRYCAPACGYGCTWASYQDAVKKADALAKLLGPAFKPHVWENLGWHYEVTLGTHGMKLSVYGHRYGDATTTSYSTLLGMGDGGDQRWSQQRSSNDAIVVVKRQLREAGRIVRAEHKAFVALERAFYRGRP